MSSGSFGKILWVNLSKDKFDEEKVEEKDYQQYLGGYGLASKILFQNTSPNTDPLSEDSVIGFFPGLLTSTAAPLSGRYMVAGKSPLTKTWGDANAGGTFGPEIKKCGYDAILIKGTANSPKFVLIKGDEKVIGDASEIWGMDIIKTEELLRQQHGKFLKVASIGKAGEKLSLISGIANDRGRIAARSGLGAILGYKKLKCLALKGDQTIPIYDKNKFMELVKDYNQKGKVKDPGTLTKKFLNFVPNIAKLMRKFKVGFSGPAGLIRTVYHNIGTCVANTISAETGDTPIKNWSGIGMYDFPFEKSTEISANKIKPYRKREYGCYSCSVQCGAVLDVPELGIQEMHLPEYETCAAFGGLLLNNNLLSIFKLNDMCNRAAIDTISTGATVAFAIECFENGILTTQDTDGLELKWGDSDVIVQLVDKIINRDGIGDLLADGCDRAAKKIGKGSEHFAMTSLGQEIAMHNPRVIKSYGFAYAYDPTPGRHTTSNIELISVGPINKFQEGFSIPKGWKKDPNKKYLGQKLATGLHHAMCSAGLCMFTTLLGPYPLLDLINALTGWDMKVDELIDVGLRIHNVRQSFVLREGINIAANELPGRIIGDPPDEKGPAKDITVDYKEFYRGFCKKMGWNPENGYPSKDTLSQLDLDYVINELY